MLLVMDLTRHNAPRLSLDILSHRLVRLVIYFMVEYSLRGPVVLWSAATLRYPRLMVQVPPCLSSS